MALGEEKAEVEASLDTKAPSCGRWSCREQEVETPGPVSGEQPPRLEAEGGPASPVWGTEGLPAPLCCPSGACQSQASNTSREPVAGASQPALSCLLPPAGVGTGDLHSVGSQVATKMEETRLSVSEEPPQATTVPRATALCSGHDADTEDDPSPLESPRVLALSQQPHISGFPFSSKWRSMVSPGAAAPPFPSCSVSASSPGSSSQGHQEKAEPQSCSLAKVSSLELVGPQSAPSMVGPGPQLQWSPQPVSSGGDGPGLRRRHLSFQAEYWACVLPDSLPPSPDRRSPLWNPNKEYEDLLDYTYPLRPRPRLPRHLESRVLADPVLQDSGVDLDSFSVSPASTLKSPTNVSHSCPPADASALPFSGPREPSFKRWYSGVPQEQGSVGLASCSQLTSTPRAAGSKDIPWERRDPALRGMKDWRTAGKHLEVGPPQLRTWDRGWPSSGPEREKGAGQGVQRPACMESGWKPEEDLESDDEYLALPTRLTQVSSLVSYLGSVPTLVTLPTRAAEGQSSLDVSNSDGPTSSPSDSSQSQLPPGAVPRGPGGLEEQNHCLLRSFLHARDSAGDGSLVSSQALGVSCGPLRTRSSLPVILDRQTFLDPDRKGQPPRRGREQGKESLMHCVKTFCCQLDELIHWLYNIADVTDHLTPPKSSLTSLKSSLQLYRQFKKDIDEHQSLAENVLQEGEILLQCLLDNTPVLKDVLRRISKQPSELESHADHLYDTILASVDMLAGCTLIPDDTPVAHSSADVSGMSLASSQAEM
ncbi:centrosomal protein of 68 kDa isoform X2 [Myotis myotis]|uniref:Centrosomal protein of 68 kDa n=1 Tax=Myotis myotis TaxID=51298 RepID=A0A7J7U442_MYOMY|nr:centrosomal protein of 68 kDa isoform X2 [Myotis myotis]XP_036190227.1 centrosomal protein of 68 kDa isoform X2 [Myotis myotis]KAF6307697.1 centrosomal protein 68 [Myotis myotis]